MSASIFRQAVLPDNVQEDLESFRRFRARVITETLTVNDRGEATYRVKVVGPTFTPKGNLHATNRSDIHYGDMWRGYEPAPEWLVPYLIGPEALLTALKEQVAQVEWEPREEKS